MQQKYEVTISMPVYNVENFVERALQSALSQTFDSIEFLIVDDRGSDDSMEKVRQIVRNHPRGRDIRIVAHDANAGLGRARNTAIDEAKGRYLYFMDSDDYIAANTIELLFKAAEVNKTDVAMASEATDRAGTIISRKRIPATVAFGEFAIAKWMQKTRWYFPIHTWNKLYDIDFLRNNDIKCIVGHMVEDTWFTFQVVMKAKSIATIPDETYYYNLNPSSHSRQKRDERFFEQYIQIFEARKKLLEKEDRKYPSEIYNYFLDPFFSFFLREAIEIKEKGFYCQKLMLELQDIFKMNFSSSNLLGWKVKLVYHLLKHNSWHTLLIFYTVDDKLRGAYRRIKKCCNFSSLPDKHF